MNSADAAGWIPVLSSFLAFVKANAGALGLIALMVAVFGVRVGPRDKPWFEVHGLLGSLWTGAQNVGLVGESLRRIERKLDRALRRIPDSDPAPETMRPSIPSVPG
jgi:hypothetical protein